MSGYGDYGIALPAGRTGEVRVNCPQCTHKRRSEHRNERDLSVNTDDGTWHCFHCGWSGGLKSGEGSASRPRAAETGKREYQRPEPIKGELTPEALAFLASRRIPEEVARRNGVVVVPDVWFPQLDGKRAAIAYPYYRDGELINIKYRAQGSKDFRLVTGCERTLYGLDDVTGVETIVIVEGEMDKLALEAAGYPNCVSVPDGAPPPDAKSYASKFAFLAEPAAEAAFAHATKIIIATDADEPGHHLAAELARRLGKHRCWRVDFSTEGHKDANDVLIEAGADYLAAIIDDAQPWPIEGVVSPRDVRAELLALYNGELDPGTDTGFYHLRWHVKPGQLTILTGMPGSGKSEWLDAVLINIARSQGWSFAYYSPENWPIERHVAKLIEKWSGKAFRQWRPEAERIERQELEFTLTRINERFIFLGPESPTLANILELAKKEIYRRGIKGLVIDPWNELESDRGGFSETEYIGKCLSELRHFARQHAVHVFVVAHPAKMQKEDGKYPVPTPYDISGSAHWFNKADNCLAVWRDKSNEAAPVEVHVQKVRFREVGELGVCQLEYDRSTSTYHDIPGEDSWTSGNRAR